MLVWPGLNEKQFSSSSMFLLSQNLILNFDGVTFDGVTAFCFITLGDPKKSTPV